MASLTPEHRRAEVVDETVAEGFMNGGMMLVPCLAGLYAAMQNPTFRKVTNWQSRTGLVITPALFIFAFTAENKMIHRMGEIAEETEHAIKSVHWAERHYQASPDDVKLHDLYRQAVLKSGVKLVEHEELGPHHKAANYVQANPFKVIVGVGVPAVAGIFWGRVGKEHLSMQLKILHTRVFGQFAVICTLLGVMGLKGVMDQQGRFITDSEVEDRVAEMHMTRAKMLHRIEHEGESHRPHKPIEHRHDTHDAITHDATKGSAIAH